VLENCAFSELGIELEREKDKHRGGVIYVFLNGGITG
jgi:hypothetical protein